MSSSFVATPISLPTAKITYKPRFFQFKVLCSFSPLTKKPLISLSHKANKQKICECNRASIPSSSTETKPSNDFVVVNFYRFVFVKDPIEEVVKHLTFVKV